jgi:hypothetical protein
MEKTRRNLVIHSHEVFEVAYLCVHAIELNSMRGDEREGSKNDSKFNAKKKESFLLPKRVFASLSHLLTFSICARIEVFLL